MKSTSLLLDRDYNVEGEDTDCARIYSPLGLACLGRHVETVMILLVNGADIFFKNGNRLGHGLHVASSNGDIEIVQLLLKNGADVNAESGCWGYPLQAAAAEGYGDIVRLLVAEGADVRGFFFHSATKGM